MELVRRTVLYATDFEPSARTVLPQVQALARALGAHVHLVHVRPSALEAFVSSGLAERQASDRLERVAKKLGEHGISTSVEVASRVDVAEGIARSAIEHHAELIVTGAPTRQRVLETATTTRVVRIVARPVWIARGAALPRKIVCGVDLSRESRDAVQLASSFGRALKASLTIASAVELPAVNPIGMDAHAVRVEEERHRAAREREVAAFVAGQGVMPASVRCMWGVPDDVLVGLADDDEYDLVVLGRRHGHDLRSFALGSTARRVIARAPCSVLVMGEGRR